MPQSGGKQKLRNEEAIETATAASGKPMSGASHAHEGKPWLALV